MNVASTQEVPQDPEGVLDEGQENDPLGQGVDFACILISSSTFPDDSDEDEYGGMDHEIYDEIVHFKRTGVYPTRADLKVLTPLSKGSRHRLIEMRTSIGDCDVRTFSCTNRTLFSTLGAGRVPPGLWSRGERSFLICGNHTTGQNRDQDHPREKWAHGSEADARGRGSTALLEEHQTGRHQVGNNERQERFQVSG